MAKIFLHNFHGTSFNEIIDVLVVLMQSLFILNKSLPVLSDLYESFDLIECLFVDKSSGVKDKHAPDDKVDGKEAKQNPLRNSK